MGSFFNTILYQPLFNALVFLYNTIAFNDLGVAIILLTVVIRVVLYPLFYKSFKNQTILQRLQPEVKKIQETHKDDKERQAKALLGLYREHKVNPFSGFILLLVQLPVLIALYRVFLRGFSESTLVNLYPFIAQPLVFNNSFLNLINLAKPNIIIVVLAALAQYFQARISFKGIPKHSEQNMNVAERMGRQMAFIGPMLTVVVLYSLPAAIGLYWLVTSIFSLIQQVIINRSLAKQGIHRGTISNPNQNTN